VVTDSLLAEGSVREVNRQSSSTDQATNNAVQAPTSAGGMTVKTARQVTPWNTRVCYKIAQVCSDLAKTAATPEQRTTLANLSKTWLERAVDAEAHNSRVEGLNAETRKPNNTGR
jgi:hypothetical protein